MKVTKLNTHSLTSAPATGAPPDALGPSGRPGVKALPGPNGREKFGTAPPGVNVFPGLSVAETFTAPGDAVERLMYGFSTLCCLPAGLAEEPSAGTGTVMRPSTLRGYALDAGFADVEILPIEQEVFRFYRLIP